ncbi:MAG: phosphate propanoyltransferase [Propionibacterium sp.]|jgi:putative phosphotransacetylase|nr:phosphate propanoyltransferase [Propionibacterium sp.]NLI84685.1 phosphate propanoyltransferase [Propionibacterium sp.]
MALDTAVLVDEITRKIWDRLECLMDPTRIVVGVSNRHVHLNEADLKTLFGLDALTIFRQVRQPNEFAAEQFVTVHGPKASLEKVRAMGPCRAKSQVELSRTDCYALGVKAPVIQSGHLDSATPIDIEGPLGSIHLEHGAMVAARHVHLGPADAAALGVKDQDLVKFAFGGQRGGVLDNFIVRVKADWVPEIHLDTDEANALGLKQGDFGKLIKK